MKEYYEVQCWNSDASFWSPYVHTKFESEADAVDWIKDFDEKTKGFINSKNWFRVIRLFELSPIHER